MNLFSLQKIIDCFDYYCFVEIIRINWYNTFGYELRFLCFKR